MRTLIGSIAAGDVEQDVIARFVAEQLGRDAPIHASRAVVEQLHADPFAVAERLNGEWPAFERVIFVSGVVRERPPGTVAAYRWDGDVTALDDAEPSTATDLTLRTLPQVAALPDEVIVVEVEPDGHDAHREPSAQLAAGLDRMRVLLRRLSASRSAARELPSAALGTGAPNRAD